MKGAKLYNVEVWHYADEPEDHPEDEWPNDPLDKTIIPDCESFKNYFDWEDILPQSNGVHPDNLIIYGEIKTYNHRAAYFLASRYPFEDYWVIGDCLLLYYTTDDGNKWRYRFNGVYFGSVLSMRMYFAEEVDTGKSEPGRLTWVLSQYHHDNTGIWNNFDLRVILQQWDEATSEWVTAPWPGPINP